ncbi:NAD(P)/FAD-dependent oxidoreductase [Pollutibacter soli]|uniref:NAD(P)/FAD-dependent oxidoreductase n=1 Tax=Pollutibacter soli TaxID=3034157 RepID=UPI0030135B31
MTEDRKRHCIVVIGGGAAGFFCAVNAARLNPHTRVVLLEKTSKLLSKVKVSGGGRCNVTHACFEIAEMAKRYPRGANFVKKTFHQFFTTDTIEWFQTRGVELKTEEDGRMFPSTNSSETIIRCLLDEAAKYKVEIVLQAEVAEIQKHDAVFVLTLADGRVVEGNMVCITSGGYPKSAQFHWISKLGHRIEEPVPSLFTFNMPAHPITELMGVSVADVLIKIPALKFKERGPVLITHWGFSGPAVLKLSAFAARELSKCDYGFSIQINWIPEYNEESLRGYLQELRESQGSVFIGSRNPFGLPHRLWQYFIQLAAISPVTRWSEFSSKQQHQLIRILCGDVFSIKGKTTFKEEFVTSGGVSLNEIDANSMQSKIVPGVYFAGEVMDVDGVTGGFNFQHAWTSGYIAAVSMSKNIS